MPSVVEYPEAEDTHPSTQKWGQEILGYVENIELAWAT